MRAAGEVPPAVSGKVRVRVADVRRKLGDAAWFTLLALWARRSRASGETTVTNAGLTRVPGFAPVKERVVRKAAARLGAAGLLVRVGWRRREVPLGRGRVERLVYVRRVLGAPAEGALGAEGVLLVPAAVAEWVEAACGWGGKRGRPPGQEGQTPAGSRGAPDLRGKDPPLPVRPETSPADAGEVALGLAPGAVPPAGGRSGAAGLPVAAFAMRAGALAGGGAERPAPPGAAPGRAEPPRSRPEPAASLAGLRLREVGPARPRPPVMATESLPGVPPYPSFALLGWPVVPDPPLLDPEARPLEHALQLAEVYRNVASRRYGSAARPGARYHPALVAAAAVFMERRIAPAAWVAWSCDAWKKHHGGARPPPVSWVFSADRIVERRGWFKGERAPYMGGKLLVGPVVKALVRRYLTMRTAIDLAAAWSDPGPVVELFFPAGSYPLELERAKAEVAATRARLRAEADRGIFLW